MSPWTIVALLGAGFASGILWRRRSRGTVPVESGWSDRLASALSSLQEYGASKSEGASRQEFCKLFLANACRLGRTERGAVLVWDEVRSALQAAASTASKAGEGFLEEPPAKLAERAFKSSEPVSVSGGAGKAFVCVPLAAGSKPLGVLQLELKAAPSKEDLRDFSLLAGEGAAVLHGLGLLENLQAFHIEMVETLYRAIHAVDASSSEHADQTRLRARRLAQALGLPEETVRHVEYAALLRGVGKIGVDQAILKKPGKLTSAEYEEIKKHTTIGYRLLAQVHLLAPAAKMVLYHQEWFNGRGYPEGLKGDGIPLGARIIAVIAAWEAMRTDRPYRKSLAREQAMAELERAAGTQFDPAVVEAFLRVEPPDSSA